MENKRKIWVRVAAFMAAIICCVLCVIPAYAEGAETGQEQENKLNAMVGADVFKAADLLVDLDYRMYGNYSVITSEQVTINYPLKVDGYATAAINQSGYVYFEYVDQNGVSGVYGQIVSDVTLYQNEVETNLIFKDTISNKTLNVIYKRSFSDGYTISKPSQIYTEDGTVNLRAWIGATWQGYCLLKTTNLGILYAVSKEIYNPSQMLSYNLVGDNDEIYNQGYAAGYQFGFEEGEMHGLEEGLDRGRGEGYTEGEADGYRTGYDDGMHQTSLIDGIKSLFRAPMEFVESALNFEIFGINMASTVKVIITAMMIALVVVVVWKAVK